VRPQDLLLYAAATAEQHSAHPLAAAIVNEAKSRGLKLHMQAEGAFTEEIGRGVCCNSGDIGVIHVGNRSYMNGCKIEVSALVDKALWDLEVQGKSAVCVALSNVILGVLGIADKIKPDAPQAISALRNMGIDVWMVTGDNRTTAETVAGDLDIPKDRIIASAMPADKVNKVLDLQKRGRVVAVVGDGINDSPALAQADLGVAVGAGSQIAGEAADMILIRNQLTDVVMALDLARVVFKRIKLNFVWAMMYNVIAIPFAAGAWYPWTKMSVPPQYAGLAMALSSISVVVSSLLLQLYRRSEASESHDDGIGGYSTRAKTKFR
jgi:Cu+-exporting ATPase